MNQPQAIWQIERRLRLALGQGEPQPLKQRLDGESMSFASVRTTVDGFGFANVVEFSDR